jgi:competence protein ComEA
MIRLDDNVKKWIFLISGISCFLFVFGIVTVFRGAFATVEEIVPSSTADAPDVPDIVTTAPVSEKWAVYITGEVLFPGVYEIEPGSRIRDAVELAGGFSRRADAEAINMAEKLRDEAHISIPPIRAANAAPADLPKPDSSDNKPVSAISYPAGRADKKSDSKASDSKIDINTADASLLSTLPGIGPKLSEAIVAYREEHGPFTSVDGIRSVRGIGDKRLEILRGLIKVTD